MYSKNSLIGMYCETALHVGAGKAVGAVDLPVQREKTTGWPTIQASGLKGAFREACEKTTTPPDEVTAIFGTSTSSDQAGAISIGDARLLLLPIRSSAAAFLWVTCPAILGRLKRDTKIMGKESAWAVPVELGDSYLGLGDTAGPVIFEDLQLVRGGAIDKALLDAIAPLLPSDDGYPASASHLCIVSDVNFGLLCESGTEVHPRIVLDENKIAKNLWYQELVPANTLFYTVVSFTDERRTGEKRKAAALLSAFRKAMGEYAQVGGDETLGKGWMRLSWQEVK